MVSKKSKTVSKEKKKSKGSKKVKQKETLYFVSFDEDIRYEFSKEAYNLAKESNIGILSDKELNEVVLNEKGDVVAGLWISHDKEEFTFDIIVDPKYRRQGIGKKLIKIAIEEYDSVEEAFPDSKMKADVVSPQMVKLLQKEGFEIEEDIYGHTIMVKS